MSAIASQVNTLPDQVAYYKKAYNITSVHQKLVDYQGRYLGPAGHQLEGLKNVKMALNGLLYWGGGLNKNRDNRNPLLPSALNSLCKEGFSSAIYLYDRGFNGAVKESHCTDKLGQSNSIHYLSKIQSKQSKEVLERIYKAIKLQQQGPIYMHCWNGFHASNAMAAVALRQFCDYSEADALKFWKTNAEGTDRRENFSLMLNFIRNFEPYPEFQISESEKSLICLSR